MKPYFIQTVAFLFVLFFIGCGEEFIYRAPQGSIDQHALANEQGLDLVVTSAYAGIISRPDGTNTPGWGSGPHNWLYAGVYGGDANKGSSSGDQPTMNDIEMYNILPTNKWLTEKFKWVYNGVRRANIGIGTVILAEGKAPQEFLKNKNGELHFLRAYFYFEGIKMFGSYIPWIDETITDPNPRVHNDIDIYPNVLADLDIAIENLPAVQDKPGRANSWAAKTLKAKVLMQQGNLTAAKPILQDVYNNGVTASGEKYGLEESLDNNWNIDTENGKESIFAAQYAYERENANNEMALTHIGGRGPGGCCNFYKPSSELANSFKVDNRGLPFLDKSYRKPPFVSQLDESDNAPYPSLNNNIPVDPRLDFAIGRFGIPYKDWGLPPRSWAGSVSNGGMFLTKKHIFHQRHNGTLAGDINPNVGSGSAMNYQILSFRDVILLLAECYANDGELSMAMNLVNEIRERAGNEANLVRFSEMDDPARVGELAADYRVSPYPKTHPTFSNKEECIKAVRMERKLELAMEGHRWFDLVRWGGNYMSNELEEYVTFEANFLNKFKIASKLPATHTMFPMPAEVLEVIGDDEEGNPYVVQRDPWK
jgi:hypothetical protein